MIDRSGERRFFRSDEMGNEPRGELAARLVDQVCVNCVDCEKFCGNTHYSVVITP